LAKAFHWEGDAVKQIDTRCALARLQSHLDIYRSLERQVSDRGEAYPGEAHTIQTHIRCLSKSILLQQEMPAPSGR